MNAAGPGPYTPASVSVPDLVGMTKLPALQMAAVMGLTPRPETSYDIFCTTGLVCSQSISPGTVVPSGASITIDIR